ncbi:MAG: phosphoribosylformylglycinamidine synthase subunit PurQ [Deltaproteobacteria bacterium]|nr:phosphoribosylformylglycinamidine synthase subunit PurQ [Deltaproteobacteria bacterium]
MKIAVVTFPGSNCDRDCRTVASDVVGAEVVQAWHQDEELPEGVTGVILPGGFSYGDALRAGSIATHSPIMASVKRFAASGGAVLGICNGFQILCESGLLPGALTENRDGRFICKDVSMTVESNVGLAAGYKADEEVCMPVAHGEGRFVADDDTLATIESGEGPVRVCFRYQAKRDDGTAEVNGSTAAIAGLVGGPSFNVLGLMPHPERCSEVRLGGTDGLPLMRALVEGGLK